MKKFLFLLVMAACAASTYAQQADSKKVDGPVITFDKKSHDFGEIVQGDKVEYTYNFTNTGTEPLLITNVNVQCGCTTPKGWPRDPVPPGGKGELTISFNSAGKIGRQDKVVTIVSNATNPDEAKLSFAVQIKETKQAE